jgi:adenylate cyclase
MSETPTPPGAREGEVLSSWKEIALYLSRSVRAVQNWEKEEGLPVRRHRHVDGASVFAHRSELDAWMRARSARDGEIPAVPAAPAITTSPMRRSRAAVFAVLFMMALVVIAVPLWKRAEPELRSLAVLPLRPLGPPADVEHLGVGIADAIVYQLSTTRAIDLRPTSAAQAASATAKDPRAIAAALGVDAVLEGTIQRAGDRIRVRIQLVDAKRNRSVFSGKFDEDARDLFAAEDRIAGAVARALSLEMSADDARAAERRRSAAPGAYEAYLKGRFHWSQRTPEGLKESIADYNEAIGHDPSYAAAWAALGESLNLLSMHRVLTPAESFPRAKEAAARALSLDATLADAHVALGTAAFYYDWNWPEAEAHLQRAIALEPRHASARHILANILTAMARHDDAARTMTEAIANDPSSVALVSISSYQLYFARRYDEGIRQARAALDRDSGFAQAYKTLGVNLIESGRLDEGIAALEKLEQLLGPDSYAAADLASGYAGHPAYRAKAHSMKPRLLDLLERRKISPFDLARYHAALGETDAALSRLEETMVRRDPGMVWLATEPSFDSLSADPRYHALLRAMETSGARPGKRTLVPL